MISSIKRILRKIKWATLTAYYSIGKGVACNLCGWQGRTFANDPWHPHTVCPNCRSHIRHRLLVAALTATDGLRDKRLAEASVVLHFAPEYCLRSFLQKHASTYLSADLLAEGYDYEIDMQLDLSDMTSIRAGHFDMIVACDVLEHVPNHIAALTEMFRTLKPGGCAVLTVPQQDGLSTTLEDPSITTPQERERLYGQRDHLRMYGADFIELLEGTGFDLTVFAASSFPTELVKQHVLFPPILSHHPLVTNDRKVYFACKPGCPEAQHDECEESTRGSPEAAEE